MSLSPAALKKLVQIPIFKGLSPAEAQEFFEVAMELVVEAGNAIFEEGDEGDALYVLLEGEVKVTKHGVELATLGPHSALGEMSLVAEGDARSATATASQPTRLLKIAAKRVQKLLRADHTAALKVVANLAQVLARRLALINERLVAEKAVTKKRRDEVAEFGKILNDWSF